MSPAKGPLEMKFQRFSFLHGKAVVTKLQKHINCGSLVLIAVKPSEDTVYFPVRIVETTDTTVRGTRDNGRPAVIIAGYAPSCLSSSHGCQQIRSRAGFVQAITRDPAEIPRFSSVFFCFHHRETLSNLYHMLSPISRNVKDLETL